MSPFVLDVATLALVLGGLGMAVAARNLAHKRKQRDAALLASLRRTIVVLYPPEDEPPL